MSVPQKRNLQVFDSQGRELPRHALRLDERVIEAHAPDNLSGRRRFGCRRQVCRRRQYDLQALQHENVQSAERQRPLAQLLDRTSPASDKINAVDAMLVKDGPLGQNLRIPLSRPRQLDLGIEPIQRRRHKDQKREEHKNCSKENVDAVHDKISGSKTTCLSRAASGGGVM